MDDYRHALEQWTKATSQVSALKSPLECGDDLMDNGSHFEQQVAELLELMGYEVQHDVLLAGKQIDILAEFLAPGGILLRILVECKFTSRDSIPNEAVYELGHLFNSIKATTSVNEALLVSNAPFTRFAKEAAASTGIILLTYEDLLQRVADFKRYLRGITEEYRSSNSLDSYIRLQSCTARQIKQIESIDNAAERRQRMDEYAFFIDDYLGDWLDSDSKHQTLLLGDYGTGKTTVCRHLSYVLAEAYLRDGYPQRIPLLINLRDYNKVPGARQLINDFLINKCRVHIDFDAFERLAMSGRFVLILDGFDEMAARVDAGTLSEIAQSLAELMIGESKVILTGRPGYFPSQKDLEARFRGDLPADPYDKASAENSDQGRLYFRHLYLLPLSRSQILELLKKREGDLQRTGKMTHQEVMTIIDTTYNLADLAERPVLLDMIVKTIPTLAHEVEHINAYRLYQVYTDFWINREESKGRRLIGKTPKLLFMQELAMQMQVDGHLMVHYLSLSPTIKQYFRISEGDILDHFSHDIRTCSFLRRDSAGYYFFAHKSFMEYFVASKLIGEIKANTNWQFGRRPLSRELLRFIQEGIAKEDHDALVRWLAQSGKADVQGGKYTAANALGVLMLSGRGCDGLDLRSKIFEGLDLQGVSLTRSDLSRCTLVDCNLSRVRLDGANLRGATLSHVVLRQSSLVGAVLCEANLVAVELEGCSLEKADLAGATITGGVKGWDKISSFKEVRLAGVTGLKYEEWEFAKTRGAVGDPALSPDEMARRQRDNLKARDKLEGLRGPKKIDESGLDGKAKRRGDRVQKRTGRRTAVNEAETED